jgi:hypothetical protein
MFIFFLQLKFKTAIQIYETCRGLDNKFLERNGVIPVDSTIDKSVFYTDDLMGNLLYLFLYSSGVSPVIFLNKSLKALLSM